MKFWSEKNSINRYQSSLFRDFLYVVFAQNQTSRENIVKQKFVENKFNCISKIYFIRKHYFIKLLCKISMQRFNLVPCLALRFIKTENLTNKRFIKFSGYLGQKFKKKIKEKNYLLKLNKEIFIPINVQYYKLYNQKSPDIFAF